MGKKREYLEIAKFYESCLETHGDTHLGVGWPRLEDTLTRFDIMLDVIRERSPQKITLLDYGCGLSHLYEYITQKEISNIVYSGLDISEKYVEASRKKYPDNSYYACDILSDDKSSLPRFDYAVINGVFTQKRELSFDQMFEFLKSTIKELLNNVEKGIAFNVMTKFADFEKDGAFHLSIDALGEFLKEIGIKKFQIRHDYGLYEYTAYIYKD